MWTPFFQLFRKYWPDCPFPVYLTTNQLDPAIPGVKVVQTGSPVDWSTEMIHALQQIPEERLIVLLEDYFILEPVDIQSLNRTLDVGESTHADFIKLGTFPASYDRLWPSVPIAGLQGYNFINSEAEYLVNLQAGIWKKNALNRILVRGESPWKFEIEASKRFAKKGFTAITLDPVKGRKDVHGPIVYLCGALTRGVLMRDAVRIARKEGILLETGTRKVETRLEELKRKFYISLPIPLRRVYSWFESRLQKLFFK